MPAVSVMFKPASSLCNLRCRYCFYHSLSEDRELPFRGMMSTDTLRTALVRIFGYADGAPVALSFQGGEPLMAGKGFFREAARLIGSLNVKRSPVTVGVQTNGTLIDGEWCDIFAQNGWLVGLSLDGDRQANAFRVDAQGNETFDKVIEAARLMTRKRVDFNVLCVLTRPVAENIERIYGFYKDCGFRFLQFIPVLKPLKKAGRTDGDAEGKEMWLTPEVYGRFLRKAFDLYMGDMKAGRYTSVRQFDNFVALANFRRAEQCGMNGGCARQFVIEGDGAVYPCDFYCLDEYCLGNVNEKTFEQMAADPTAVGFIEESRVYPEKCKRCNYFRLCGGGCKRERVDLDKCEEYKKFFAYALPHMRRMS